MIEPFLSDDAFLADVESTPRLHHRLDLWWLGQSGYLAQTDACRMLIDPYLSDSLTTKYAATAKPHDRISRRVVDPSRFRGIDLITSSHAHTDHLDAETLRSIRQSHGDDLPLFVAPRATEKTVIERWGEAADAWMDDGSLCSWDAPDIGIHAVPATHEPKAVSPTDSQPCLGYVFHLCPFYVYHAGDTVWDEKLVERLRQSFKTIDLAILPINGKVGNMNGTDAARLAKDIGAKLVVPCHYDLFAFNTADPAALFVPECVGLSQPHRVLRLGERLTITR